MIPQINKIYQGDCREIMSQWDDECIDMSISSPPYWSLRNYKLKPLIWDGDENCEHEWGDEIKPKQKSNWDTFNKYVKENDRIGSGKSDTEKQVSQDNFCSLCGAWKGQLGLEPTFDLYIKHLCDIFNEVKRVLKKEGTCWVNLGDTYNGSGGCGWTGLESKNWQQKAKPHLIKSYPSKSLCCIPERFKIEMINRGWILRNTIIWHKPNPMPSSAKDRFTVDFEYLFFFTKNNKSLFWTNEKTLELVTKQPLGIKGIEGIDWEWRETGDNYSDSSTKILSEESEKFGSPRARVYRKKKRKKMSLWTGHDYYFEQQFEPILLDSIKRERRGVNINKYTKNEYLPTGVCPSISQPRKFVGYHNVKEEYENCQGRNMRCVWTIPTMPCSEAHFAVFPEKLLMIPIKSGCPEFICKKCGKARVKIWEPSKEYAELLKQNREEGINNQDWFARKNPNLPAGRKSGEEKRVTADYQFKGYTDCNCNAGFEGGIVLDLFAGRGTTGIVAQKLGRRYILIDLSSEYIEMAKRNLSQGWLI